MGRREESYDRPCTFKTGPVRLRPVLLRAPRYQPAHSEDGGAGGGEGGAAGRRGPPSAAQDTEGLLEGGCGGASCREGSVVRIFIVGSVWCDCGAFTPSCAGVGPGSSMTFAPAYQVLPEQFLERLGQFSAGNLLHIILPAWAQATCCWRSRSTVSAQLIGSNDFTIFIAVPEHPAT
jgi:hypothetical protein